MTLTLKEAFATAFTEEADVLLTLVGVPDDAFLTVMHVPPDLMADRPGEEAAAAKANITETVTLNDAIRIIEMGGDVVTVDGPTEDDGRWGQTQHHSWFH